MAEYDQHRHTQYLEAHRELLDADWYLRAVRQQQEARNRLQSRFAWGAGTPHIRAMRDLRNELNEQEQAQERTRLQITRLPRHPPQHPAASARGQQHQADMRILADFLFECKDLVSEGTYLAASDALQRRWNAL